MRIRAVILGSIVLIVIASHTSIVTAEQQFAPSQVEPAFATVSTTNTPTRMPTPTATRASQAPPMVTLPRPATSKPTSQGPTRTVAPVSAPTRAATRMPVPTSQPAIFSTRTPLPTPIPSTSKTKTVDVVRTSKSAPAAQTNLLTTSAAYRFWQTEPKEASVTTFGDQVVVAPGPNDEVNVIIQLKDEPVATYNARLFGVRVPLTQQQRSQVQSYTDRLKASRQQVVSQAQQMAIPLQVKREYSYLSNGLAASVKMKDMVWLAGLPGVKKVYRDQQVHIVLQDSVPLIGAPSVWAMTDSGGHAVTGQGIRVAIIDTGIDYTHPDLGGCFGPTCKVIGGYDFVNNDADPMDDMGHGTHVAGIVAANGVLKGVAPDARLLAYKVLNQYGSGSWSDIIAAIERATNPDGDPTTNDAVDVINMSLGGSGDPDDPMCQAVDAAVNQGVVVAIAAGNSGPRYQTVGSPGVARKAFTVGATTKSDALASFSSKGPVPGSFAIKPDILAPGVSINSTVPTGGVLGSPSRYRSLNGTSMATPHIAGSVALIKQLHPNWTPAMIQASLMNSAKDLGLSAFAQGAGREQVNQAALVRALMTPGSLSLGLDNISQSLWITTTTFQIQNVSTTAIDYSLSVSGSLPAGISTSLEPSSVSLAPGAAATVTFRITVDNTVVPFPTEAPYAYGATIVAQSGSERLTLPFAFIKSSFLQITFDQEPWTVLIHNRNNTSWFYAYPGTSLTALVPPGTYDVMVLYYNPVDTWVAREGVVVNTLTSLTINRSDAIYTARIIPKDKDNRTLADFFDMGQFLVHKTSYNTSQWVYSWRTTDLDRHFSQVSNSYTWEWSAAPNSTPEFYAFNGAATNGIANNLTYQNDSANFKHVIYRHHPDPGYGKLYVTPWIGTGPYYGSSFSSSALARPLTMPFVHEAYLMPPPYPGFFFGYTYLETYDRDPYSSDGATLLERTPYLFASSSTEVRGYLLGLH